MAFFGHQSPNLPLPPAPSGPIPPVNLRSSKVPKGRHLIGGSRLAGLIVISLSKKSVPDFWSSRFLVQVHQGSEENQDTDLVSFALSGNIWFFLSSWEPRYFKPACSSFWFDELKASTKCHISVLLLRLL